MAKPKKKPTKRNKVEWQSILVSGLIDLIVGALLLLLNKLIE